VRTRISNIQAGVLRSSIFIILAAFLAIFSSHPLQGQIVGGSINGTVADASGAYVSGATVILRNLETGNQRTLSTGTDGRYSAPSVPVGKYQITVSKAGFGTQVTTGINLVVGQTLTLNLALTVGAVEQKVTVEATPQSVNLSTQQVSGLVDERQVKELPLNGRSYDTLILLNPGVVNYTAQRSGGIGTSNSSVGNMFSITGHRPQDNIFLLNGIEYTGASLINVTPGGTSGQLLGVDAVREFNVASDGYGAEYGKRTGAQISIITDSGSNAVHGALYEFLRNSALDARNYFDQAKIPEFQRNVFGGSLGGPLRKNKLFLFGNYEGYRQNLGLSDVTLVPDNEARLGYVPNSSGTEQYVGVNASVAPLLNLWPVQNGAELTTAGGLPSGIAYAYSSPPQHIREDFGTTRFDDNISDRDLLFGVYTIDDSIAHTPSANPLSLVEENLREQVLSVQEQHIFSPNFLNTARIGFSRASYYFTGIVPVNIPGWVTGDTVGAIVISGSTASNGASTITGAGANTGSNNATARNLFTYDDHFYWTHGRHQIEAGSWAQRIQSNDNLAQNQYGQASFSTLTTFLQGTVATFTVVPAPTELGWRSTEAAGFVSDTFHITPRLEIRAGFRFESTNGWNEAHGRASNYSFANGVISTNPTVGSSALPVNNAKFLPNPRLGLAWDPFGNGKTAVHASVGLYHSLLDTLDYRLDQTAPYNTTSVQKTVPVSSLVIAPGSGAVGTISPSNVQPDISTPAVVDYTLKIEQQVAKNTTLSIGYVGYHGYHQIQSEDENEPVPVACSTCFGGIQYVTGSKDANPAVANTTSWVSHGVSSYNGLQVDVRRNFSSGLQFRGVYTYSKALDDGSAWNTSVSGNTPAFVEYPGNPKLDWGPSAADMRHIAAVNATYDLPFGDGRKFFTHQSPWVAKSISGFTVSGILTEQSGFPFSPQLGYNPTGSGDTRNPVRPNLNPTFTGNLYPKTVGEYFNPNAYTAPATGTLGDAGRDSLKGPDLSELDASLTKTTAINQRLRLQFRAEFFNILNHANFNTPNPVVYTAATTQSPTAGVITATSTTSRQIQFGAKILF
jgi:hypothetical protein